jgi:hypothetical protein
MIRLGLMQASVKDPQELQGGDVNFKWELGKGFSEGKNSQLALKGWPQIPWQGKGLGRSSLSKGTEGWEE